MNRVFTVQSKYNLGQVELICDILKNNLDLALDISDQNLNYFTFLIVKHGRYEEFLSVFEVLLENSNTKILEINNKIIHCLIPKQKFASINVI